MPLLFKPKKDIFSHFDILCKHLVSVGKEVLLIPDSFPKDIKMHAQNMRDIEKKADDVTHTIIDEIHKSFITPIDREDLHMLAHRTDDIIDFVENAVSNIVVYNITKSRKPLPEFCEIVNKATIKISEMLYGLKNSKDQKLLYKKMVEVNDLESESDELLKKALTDLFENEKNIKSIIKWKDIFQTFERSLDRAEDVANIIEGIVIKHS